MKKKSMGDYNDYDRAESYPGAKRLFQTMTFTSRRDKSGKIWNLDLKANVAYRKRQTPPSQRRGR